MIEFEWDDANRDHVAEHKVAVHEAEEAFQNEPVDLEIQEDDEDGFRYKQIGETQARRILVLLSTVRGANVRIISAWDAPKGYKDFYLLQKASQSWEPRL